MDKHVQYIRITKVNTEAFYNRQNYVDAIYTVIGTTPSCYVVGCGHETYMVYKSDCAPYQFPATSLTDANKASLKAIAKVLVDKDMPGHALELREIYPDVFTPERTCKVGDRFKQEGLSCIYELAAFKNKVALIMEDGCFYHNYYAPDADENEPKAIEVTNIEAITEQELKLIIGKTRDNFYRIE
jgi:hypothetical protein